jgi:hypothetical protein
VASAPADATLGDADTTLPDPLETCAAVARLGTSPDVLPELVRLLEEATGGPVAVIARANVARRTTAVVLTIDGGRRGVLLLQPTVAAWSDPASPARIVLARLLDQSTDQSTDQSPDERRITSPVVESESVARVLLDGFEVERRELAERMHRGVLQSLVGSRYLFDVAQTAQGQAAEEALALAREAVREALAEGRALLRDVTPRVGDRASLVEEAALLPGISVSTEGTAALSSVMAATAYRLLQALSRTGEPITVSLTEVGGRLRLTMGRLTNREGRADRSASATGAGFVPDGPVPHLDRLRLIGVRVVEDGEQLVLDLPVAPRLPVQRASRAAGRQPAGTTPSTKAQRPIHRAPRRSEGNP